MNTKNEGFKPDWVLEDAYKALKMQATYQMRDKTWCNCPAGKNEWEPKGKMPVRHSTACEYMRDGLKKIEAYFNKKEAVNQ